MTREEACRLLADAPVFWSRLGFCYDPPRAGADGKPIVFCEDFAKYRRCHDAFSAIGVNVHSSIIHSGWMGVDRYDYSLTDRTLDALLKGAPERLYIPRVKLNVPPEWCRVHPEETFVYYGGPSDPAEIAALADTPAQDWFGFESEMGYPTNGGSGFVDDRPNLNGVIGLQSFSSKIWVKDACEALKRFIEHLENGPYARQILAYHVAFGCCGETTNWGSWRAGGENRRGDYGISHRRDFLAWGVQKYGSLEAVEEAWKQTGLTPDTLIIPSPNRREAKGQTLEGMFFAEADQALLPDYHAFLSEKCAEAVLALGKTVHEIAGKPAGAFYGYLVVPQAAYAGHLAVEKILSSPDVDFLASPRAYDYCIAGEPGGEQAPTQSYNRRKIWMDELDNWTHLDLLKRSLAARNMFETRTLLWREVSKNLAFDQNFWWMDLGEGWYDSPEIMAELKTLRSLIAELRAKPRQRAAEVLIVVDEESLQTTAVSYTLNQALTKRVKREIRLCGAMADEYRLRDLFDMDLSGYRFIVFINAFALTVEQKRVIEARVRPGAAILWHYAPGVRGGNFDLSRVKAIAGLGVLPHDGHDPRVYADCAENGCDYPALRVAPDSDIQPLMTGPDGSIVLASAPRGEGTSYLCAEPVLTSRELRPLMERAGVTLPAPEGCAVYADSRFTAVYPHEDARVSVPDRACTELITGARYPAASGETIDVPARGAAFFRFDD